MISILGYEIIRDISIIYYLKFWIFDNFSYKWDLVEILFHSCPRDPDMILERSLINNYMEILAKRTLYKEVINIIFLIYLFLIFDIFIIHIESYLRINKNNICLFLIFFGNPEIFFLFLDLYIYRNIEIILIKYY